MKILKKYLPFLILLTICLYQLGCSTAYFKKASAWYNKEPQKTPAFKIKARQKKELLAREEYIAELYAGGVGFGMGHYYVDNQWNNAATSWAIIDAVVLTSSILLAFETSSITPIIILFGGERLWQSLSARRYLLYKQQQAIHGEQNLIWKPQIKLMVPLISMTY